MRKRYGQPGWRALCNSTVTVYRRDGLTRQVLQGVYFDSGVSEAVSRGTVTAQAEFLLVVPGFFEIMPGDKIIRGEGPEIRSWQALCGADLPGLVTAKDVRVRHLAGKVSHVEVR